MTVEEFAAKVAAKLCKHCRHYKPKLDTELNRYRHTGFMCDAGAVWKTLAEEETAQKMFEHRDAK